ncbi:MAG: hypothetical protein PHT39_04270 [Sphaerochaetaceae bacterium]|nr:hypothetical protein [Sphaerochaetaceae bacterium]MDD3163639.1 hypothetical protein [Sphaerochaetaceae bacterium]MDD4396771.1 hypothetical protein [Sphaerochaetaceae bacterium]
MKRSICVILAALLLGASAFAAGNVTARTDDGRIAILHEDSTFEYFVEDTPDMETGFSIDAPEFLGIDWDSAKLIRLGNTISSGRGKLYTLGDFYVLELTASSDSSAKTEAQWNTPVLKLSDGSEVKGFGQSLEQYYTATSTFKMRTGKQERTTVYSLVFEVPDGQAPASVGFSKKADAEPSWVSLGAEGSLE